MHIRSETVCSSGQTKITVTDQFLWTVTVVLLILMILLQVEWLRPAFQPDFWQPSSSALISFPAPSVEILFDYLILQFLGLEHLGHYFTRQMEPSFCPPGSNMTFSSSSYTGMGMINAILVGEKEAENICKSGPAHSPSSCSFPQWPSGVLLSLSTWRRTEEWGFLYLFRSEKRTPF